jgi:hypothetical protein
MSCQFNLELADEGTWRRKAILRSEDLVRKLPHIWMETGGGGALEGVLMWSVLSGKTCL